MVFESGLFPNGTLHYALGGLFIGAGVSLIYLLTGLRAGASSFFTTTLSFITKYKYFHEEKFRKSRIWRIVFSAGLILGALLFTFTYNKGELFTTQVQWWRLLIGGFLVGFGTRLSHGCTSGHGICGVSYLNFHSILATFTFLVIGIIVAVIVATLGVLP